MIAQYIRAFQGFCTGALPRAALVAALTAALILLPGTPRADSPATSGDPTLYERLGGYDAIAAVVDELLARMEGKFAGYSTDSRMRVRQHIIDLMCQETGGPCYYAGRDLETAHAGLEITGEQWDDFVQVFVETLDAFEVPDAHQAELADLMLPLEAYIVENP